MGRTKLLGVSICALISAAVAQQSSPQTPEDALTTRELIAWSQLQKPQPAPQPLPAQDTPVPQPEPPRDQQAKPPADPHRYQEPVQWLSGKVVKQGGRYLLQLASHISYELEGEGDLSSYESQNVSVFGPVNAERMTIRALEIKLRS